MIKVENGEWRMDDNGDDDDDDDVDDDDDDDVNDNIDIEMKPNSTNSGACRTLDPITQAVKASLVTH